ncbi:MAG: succinate dehydrogenase, hydrophobic membrane anchor protein [Alphaproteobacteria bacterium]|nr:succinate dehydrogenase, hydrophobic membrane anchor protein [Alphaproteobacteria bacterium]
MKTPMARARGLGSSGTGTHHWLQERISSVALIPLFIWAIWSAVFLAGADYFIFTGWLSEPINSVLMILLIILTAYHAALGLGVVIEDYVHHEGAKMIMLIAQKLFFFALAIAGLFSVCKIAFGA